MKLLANIAYEYEYIHTGIGIFGNTSFVVGSVFFLFEKLKTPGIWLFIIGSSGMLIGSVGDALVMRRRKKKKKD